MGRRRPYKKRTTIDKDIFGRKLIETEYVPAGYSLSSFLGIAIILVLLFASRGC